jgi:hypothetical protein
MLVPNRGEILISKPQRSSIPVQNHGEILFPFRTVEKYYSRSKPQRNIYCIVNDKSKLDNQKCIKMMKIYAK